MDNISSHPGQFIVFEGGDGAGKSTQIALLQQWLERQQIAVVVTREPGGTPLAETLRNIVLQGTHMPLSELLLIIAARHDHLQRVIWPALSAGKWVLCDRFIDSTLAYQGAGLGIEENLITSLHQQICGDIWPDLTVTLALGKQLQHQRKPQATDGIESRDDDYQARVDAMFVNMAQAKPAKYLLLPADQTREQIYQTICERIVTQFLTG